MSVNTAHTSNGVLIHAGEYILLHSDNVSMDFSGQDNPLFKGTKQGRIYLTSHRMIFNSKKPADAMQSFSAPFIAMSDVELEQPVFAANYIKGKVRAQPNGNFVGEVKFKLHFKAGGAIEYGQALLRAASTAQSNMRNGNFPDDPPPYTPAGAWHEAPPPAYQPPPGYYGWLPTHDAFSGPPPNSVFVSDNPPPYPGIGGPPPYAPHAQQPMAPQQPGPNWGGYGAPQPAPPYQQHPAQQPSWGGYDQPSYNSGGFSGPPGAPMQPGFVVPPGGQQQQPGGYYGAGYPGQPGASQPPPQQPPYNYPSGGAYGGAAGGAPGFGAPPANPKEAEAMASAYNTPYNQRSDNPGPNGMPPSYNDLPPHYNDSMRRNQ